MTNVDSKVDELYGWELNLATVLTQNLLTICLKKIILYQPENPEEYLFYLFSSWDGQSSQSFDKVTLVPVVCRTDNFITDETLESTGLSTFFEDFLLDLSYQVKTLLPKDAPLQSPQTLHTFITSQSLQQAIVTNILPQLLQRHHISVGNKDEVVCQEDDNATRIKLSSRQIEYGTKVDTRSGGAESEEGFDIDPEALKASHSAPAKLHSMDSYGPDNVDGMDGSVIEDLDGIGTSEAHKKAQIDALRRKGRREDDEEFGFIEGEDLMNSITDAGTFAAGSTGGKNELRIQEEEEAARKRAQLEEDGVLEGEGEEQEYEEGVPEIPDEVDDVEREDWEAEEQMEEERELDAEDRGEEEGPTTDFEAGEYVEEPMEAQEQFGDDNDGVIMDDS